MRRFVFEDKRLSNKEIISALITVSIMHRLPFISEDNHNWFKSYRVFGR